MRICIFSFSPLQNYCPTSMPARYKARQFLKTCAVPLIKYKRTDSCAKQGSKKWCPACLEGNKKEIWTISLLTARSSAAGTKRTEWHWWMSLRFHCRDIQVENYLVRAEALACCGIPLRCATTGTNYKSVLEPARLSRSNLKNRKRPSSPFLSLWFMRVHILAGGKKHFYRFPFFL